MTSERQGSRSYGFTVGQEHEDALGYRVEQIRINGYTVIEQTLNCEQTTLLAEELDRWHEQQASQYSAGALERIGEAAIVRAPLVQSGPYRELAAQPDVLALVRALIGDYVQLHLQNGILNLPQREHHQRAWHRDLPYQNFEISTPLAISALYALDDFTLQSGGTELLPFSHRLAQVPSPVFLEANKVQIVAPAGSVIVFDSMVIHRAGANVSNAIRRGVNHVFTVPLLKQQIDLPRAMEEPPQDPRLRQLFGYSAAVPASETEYRRGRMAE